MEHCSGCGAAMPASAEWCGQCYLPRGGVASAAAVPAAAIRPVAYTVGASNLETATARRAAMVKTRWRKTPTTFGPAGRLACTGFLVVVLALFVFGAVVSGGLDLAGLGIWGFVIMPWALRDIWKAGQLPGG